MTLSGIVVGGTLSGALSVFVPVVSNFVPAAEGDPTSVAGRVAFGLFVSFIGAGVGGVLGLLEGLILAFPLAAILGRFGDGT